MNSTKHSAGSHRFCRGHSGFTLIELMITVAVIAILTAIALPSYRQYVLRGYLVDATNLLSTFQAQMERYYQDNRTYASISTPSTILAPCDQNIPVASRTQGKFVLTCGSNPAQSTTGYSLIATGTANMTGFVYTVDNLNNKTTTINATAFPGWLSSTTCWVVKAGTASC